MRVANFQVFDDFISGTGAIWYSSADLNRSLGQADMYAIHAVATNVAGTSPTLTVGAQYSSDGQNWFSPQNDINAQPLVNGGSLVGFNAGSTPLGANIRFQISLGGTSPQCRLKLYFTGRTN